MQHDVIREIKAFHRKTSELARSA